MWISKKETVLVIETSGHIPALMVSGTKTQFLTSIIILTKHVLSSL